MRYRNKKYLNWISQNEHTCVICGEQGWDDNQIIAHHCISIPGLNLGGMGTKASDTFAIPMHVICHSDFHTHFDAQKKEEQPIWLMTFQEKVVRLICEQTPKNFWTGIGLD
ncbi:MAG TPA: hypothetical protein DCS15_07175 [Flavobacteriales bacterium]|nr:hypothetical protein [Flavobacteriales bacterium]